MSEWEVFLRVKPGHKLCKLSLTVRFYATYRTSLNYFHDMPHSRYDILNWPRNSVCSTVRAGLHKWLHLWKNDETDTTKHTNFAANLEFLTAKEDISRNCLYLFSQTVLLSAMTLLKDKPKLVMQFRKQFSSTAFFVIVPTALV
jgi:hypothetical protein